MIGDTIGGLREKSCRPSLHVMQTTVCRKEFDMREEEKKLLQAKHRLEEAEMRSREKERKARTRRLIQEGAILEKVLPQIKQMPLEELEVFLPKVYR